MKKIILYKLTPSVQIGHLYEHLFCTRLAEHFRHEGLFSYLDYYINAKTYHSGFIRLELDLYTPEALQNEICLRSLPVPLTDDTVSGALLQIMAEKQADIKEFDEESVLSTLRAYSTQPWKPLEEIVIDDTSPQKVQQGFTLMPRSGRHFGILQQTISFSPSFNPQDRKVYLPLFAVISRALRLNLQEEIANGSYCYSYEDDFVADDDEIKDINLYRIDKRQATQILNEAEITKTLLKRMVNPQFVARLSEFLLNATSKSGMMPDDEEIMKTAGMAIGPKGWHQVGTQENIREVLEHISIEFKLGRSRENIKLEAIVDC